MGETNKELSGPDLKSGVMFNTLAENEPLLGHYEGEQVLLVRQGSSVLATSATCTHYSGPLAEGLVVGDTIRCPWHHARFSLLTGEAEGAPALDPIACYNVRRQDGIVKIDGKKKASAPAACPVSPSSVIVIGTGAAGTACAEMLRTKGYAGPITCVGGEEPSGTLDRPNLSKDFLAGSAPEEWTRVRTPEHFVSRNLDLVNGDPALRITTTDRSVELRSGRKLNYGALVLATGAEPRSLPIEGAHLPHVFHLRTLGDAKAIIAASEKAKSCAVVGSGFIGMEVAASMRQRGVDVSVIGNGTVPLGKVLGEELGRFIQGVHEEHGVRFFLNAAVRAIEEKSILLADGKRVDAGMVVIGVGVSPRTSLAESANIRIDDGVVVDEMLRTSAPDIYAAGDIARYPEAVSGEPARIEHWVVAERQGQAVARALVGAGGPFRDAPFFWSQHYDLTLSYVGHAAKWDHCQIMGDLGKRDACAVYRKAGSIVAVATIGRDRLSLEVEAAMESGDPGAIEGALAKADRKNG